MQHNRHPVGFHPVLPHTAGWYQIRAINPLCGDEIELAAYLQPFQTATDQAALLLSELAFCGDSCAICTASASMMCAQMSGHSTRQAVLLAQQFIDFVREHTPLGDQRLQPLSVFAQLQQLPNRKSCAILPWQALQNVLAAVNNSEHQ